MHYEKNQYSEGFSICGLIIAGAFLYWGFNTLATGFFSNLHLWWIGFIFIGIGIAIISEQVYALSNRRNLRNIVKYEFEENPKAKIEDVSANTGITAIDVRAIVLDLKARGELKGKFSSKTGEMKYTHISESSKSISKSSERKEEKSYYCPNCGTPVKKGEAIYCSYCGAKL
ncbi:MAG: zinc ribbon domain-containing protein [Promethearchaeota archaeon]|nr:MAG: zinc ribbon domain-containing protein [Candidatus Lokiarchaeota archaeon]